MEEKISLNRTFIDKAIDFIFSKEGKYLMLILLIALVLRFLTVSNVTPLADEMVHGTHAIDFIKKGTVSHMTQCPVWFYLTDMAYRIFNVTLFSARFLSFFFGFLTIIVVYLIAKLLFDKKVALISAFLLAISPYFSRYALSYMDETMIFFVLLAAYVFIKTFKEKEEISLVSALLLGVAMLIKIIAATFIFVFTIFIFIFLYKKYKTDRLWLTKKRIFKVILFFAIIFLMFSPVWVYNYTLYKTKGIVDVNFGQFFNINRSFYQGPGLAHNQGFVLNEIPRIFKGAISVFSTLAPIEFFLAIIGFFLAFKYNSQEKKYIKFLIYLFLAHFLTLITMIGLQTHYVPFVCLFVIFGAVTIEFINRLIKDRFNFRYTLLIILIAASIINLIILSNFMVQSPVEKMREFAISSIDGNSLVIADGRVYQGRTAWMFNDKHYLDASYFSELINLQANLSGQPIPVKAYFIECVTDDCGWGTISGQPEFNQSMEGFTEFFKNNSQKTTVFTGDKVENTYNKPYFSIYEVSLSLKPQSLEMVDQTHEFFFYPVRYKMQDKIYDKFPITGFDSLLYKYAFLVLYLGVAIAIISPLYLIYLLPNNL